MHRLSRIVAFVALLGLFVGVGNSFSADDKFHSSKEIMQKVNKKDVGLIYKIGDQLKGDKPDWDVITKESKEVAELCADLVKNKPAMGEKDSWEKLCKQYDEMAKSLLAASEKKEVKDAKEAQSKLAMSCKECHTAHRIKK